MSKFQYFKVVNFEMGEKDFFPPKCYEITRTAAITFLEGTETTIEDAETASGEETFMLRRGPRISLLVGEPEGLKDLLSTATAVTRLDP